MTRITKSRLAILNFRYAHQSRIWCVRWLCGQGAVPFTFDGKDIAACFDPDNSIWTQTPGIVQIYAIPFGLSRPFLPGRPPGACYGQCSRGAVIKATAREGGIKIIRIPWCSCSVGIVWKWKKVLFHALFEQIAIGIRKTTDPLAVYHLNGVICARAGEPRGDPCYVVILIMLRQQFDAMTRGMRVMPAVAHGDHKITFKFQSLQFR